MDDKDKELIRNFMIGGAAIGGGTALTTSLLNYLKRINKNQSSQDDDTLYVYQNPPAETEKKASLAGGLALTGGLLSTMGAYALVRKMYTDMRKSQAQSDLDKAQVAMLEAQGFSKAKKPSNNDKQEKVEVVKEASTNGAMGIGEFAASMPIAVPLVLALGSGVVAHKLLDKTFPIAKPKAKGPRRIEIVDPPAVAESKQPAAVTEKPSDDVSEYSGTDVDAKVEEALSKTASIVTEDDELEFLMRMAVLTKKANSDLANLVSAVATGDLDLFKSAAQAVGYYEALEVVKGAAHRPVDPLAEHFAYSCLAKSAALKTQTGVLAAAEFADQHPHMFRIASNLDDDTKECLWKIAGILGHAIRSERSEELGIRAPKGIVKGAMTDALIEDATQHIAGKALSKSQNKDEDSTNTSGEEANTTGSSASRKKKPKLIASSKTGRRLLNDLDDDIIDKILNPSDS